MICEADGSGYFLYHSIGQYPEKDRQLTEVLTAFARIWSNPDDAQWPGVLAQRQRFIDHWCHLIKAPAGTIGCIENVTAALYTIIESLPKRRLRQRLLVTADCFPSLHFLLSGLAERLGLVLETVPLRPGEYWVREEDIFERWADDVGVALLTLSTSTASYRCSLHELLHHGQSCGTVTGVDITQGIGLLPYDLDESSADFTVSTTLKWLCGAPGAGIVQMKEELIRECEPALRGWFSQEDIFSWDLRSFRYAPDARRFGHGTPGVLGCIASVPALAWHSSQDHGALLAHNRRLCSAIIEGADDLGLVVASPRGEQKRGGSVGIELPNGVDSAHLLDSLRALNIFADCRGKVLRLSPGNMTTMEGVNNLIRALANRIKR